MYSHLKYFSADFLPFVIYCSKYSKILFESRIAWKNVALNGKEDIIRGIRSLPVNIKIIVNSSKTSVELDHMPLIV